jgi:hypothetical protein
MINKRDKYLFYLSADLGLSLFQDRDKKEAASFDAASF